MWETLHCSFKYKMGSGSPGPSGPSPKPQLCLWRARPRPSLASHPSPTHSTLCCIALPAVGRAVLGTQEIFDPCLLNEKRSGRREAWKDGQGLSHGGLCVVSKPRNVHLEKPTPSQGIPQRTPVWGLQHSASAGMDSVL